MHIEGILKAEQEGKGSEVPTSHSVFAWVSSEKGLFFLLALSLILKVVLFGLSEIISNDGPRYIYLAHDFLEGNWLEAIQSSGTFLYSLAIAVLGRLGFDLILAGKLISLASSVLLLIPLYRFFLGIANSRVAFWGCLAFAFSPSLNKFSVAVMRDPLFLLVFAWLVYFGWRALEEKKWQDCIWVLLLSCLAPLLRLEGLLFLPTFILALTINSISEPCGRKLFVKRAGIFVSILISASLCGYFLLAKADIELSSQRRVQQVRESFQQVKERGLFYASPKVVEYLREMETVIPGGVSSNDFSEIARDHILLIYFIGFVSVMAKNLWPPFFLALLLGLTRLVDLRKGLYFFIPLLFAFSGLAYWFSTNHGFLDERYTYISTLLLCVVVGLGLEKISLLLMKLPSPKIIVVIFLFVVICIPSVQAVKREAKPEAISTKEAGEWLTKQPQLQACSLASNGEKIPFYAKWGSDFIHVEFSTKSQMKAMIETNKPDLIAFESRRSNLDAISFPGYKIIAKFEDQRYISLVYRLVK